MGNLAGSVRVSRQACACHVCTSVHLRRRTSMSQRRCDDEHEGPFGWTSRIHSPCSEPPRHWQRGKKLCVLDKYPWNGVMHRDVGKRGRCNCAFTGSIASSMGRWMERSLDEKERKRTHARRCVGRMSGREEGNNVSTAKGGAHAIHLGTGWFVVCFLMPCHATASCDFLLTDSTTSYLSFCGL